MANAKEIKRRISSIKNTAQITKAMELISTVKMKKAQDLALEKKLFVSEMLNIFLKIEDSLKDFSFFKKGGWNKTLAIMIASNKGLCWGYNVNVMKKVNSYAKETWEEIDYITIWKRAAQFVAKTWNNLVADFSENYSDNIEPSFSKEISKLILDKFASGEYEKVTIFYQYYRNTLVQIPVARKFLEISKEDIMDYFKQVLWEEKFEEIKEKNEQMDSSSYEFEPSAEEVAEDMMPMLMDMMLFDIIAQAKASEHASRMVAMKAAKDNANKYAGKLTVEYNKARQAAITKEVSEIVAWVESMKD